MNRKIVFRKFSELNLFKNRILIFDASKLIEENKKIRKSHFRRGSLYFLSSLILTQTPIFHLIGITSILATLNLSNWSLMLKKSKKLYIKRMFIFEENEEKKLYINFKENNDFFVTKLNNFDYSGNKKKLKEKLERIEENDISLFTFRIRDTLLCNDIELSNTFDKKIFYMLFDRISDKNCYIDYENFRKFIEKEDIVFN